MQVANNIVNNNSAAPDSDKLRKDSRARSCWPRARRSSSASRRSWPKRRNAGVPAGKLRCDKGLGRDPGHLLSLSASSGTTRPPWRAGQRACVRLAKVQGLRGYSVQERGPIAGRKTFLGGLQVDRPSYNNLCLWSP